MADEDKTFRQLYEELLTLTQKDLKRAKQISNQLNKIEQSTGRQHKPISKYDHRPKASPIPKRRP